MRKFILGLLLATTAATPAMAQSTPAERKAEREKARAERADRPAARADRSEARPERGERIEQRRVQAPERNVAPRQVERPAVAQRDRRAEQRAIPQRERSTVEQRREARDGVANWRQEQRDQLRQSRADRPDRAVDRMPRPRVRPPASARPNVPAPAPRAVSRVAGPQWRSSWHNDRRHDWRDHRRRYGSLFRLGFYFDPFGWNYQRYGRGWRLWPSYYQSSYWLNDPSMYRLPYAPHPYKWVRYWDDALLVDTYSGQVVDVVHDFFW
jgi:hypothetical protein